MNAHDSGCDHQRIDDFLNSDHVGLDDPDLVDHLDSCATCRAYMERQAAEPEGWSKAAELLQPNEFDHASTAEYSAATIGDQRVARSGAIQNVLDSLTPSDDPHRLGRLGGYEVSGVVGVGGMGVVLKAVDPSLDRVVAIKVMAPHLANNATARKRFSREAKAAAAVLHPNVIPIHCVSSDDAIPYLVMAYIRGGSLQKRLEQEGPLPTVEILRIGSQIAAGLAAAHEQGLVHRDIKPENILLEEGVERVALTDFGLARAVDDASVTREGTIAGTPQYMSPEQARGESVDQKSDLFSLGSVLYALCTGRPPFRADSSYGVMRRISDSAPTPIRELNSDIPDWLAGIIEKLMAKEKAERFESAGEVHELLEACLSHVQQPTAAELPSQLLAMNKPSESKGGLLSRLYQKAVDVGIMTPKEGEMQARRLADLLWFLPVVAIILIGFWSHRHLGSDGILGVLLGLYGLAYLAIFVPRLDTETAPPLRRIISKHWKAVAILFLACIVGGGLEMFARGLFSRRDSAFLMVGGGCASKGEGWCFSSGSIYLRRDEPGVLFGMYEDPAGDRQLSYVVLLRHNARDLTRVSSANKAGLTFDGEVASMKDGITIDGKGIELALEVHVNRHGIESTVLTIDGKPIDVSKGRLFLVDLTSDVVTRNQVDARLPGNLPDPQDMAEDTELVSKAARQFTQQLTKDNIHVREFLAGGALRADDGRSASQNDAEVSDYERIQGAWQVTHVEENGQLIQPPQEMKADELRLDFAENTVAGPGGNNNATYKLDPSTIPKSIDMTEDGRTKLGIYDLQGDTLRICVAEGREERPRAFDSQPDSANNVIMIMKRIPPALEKRRQHTLDRLDWTGGSVEDRHVRDRLVAALQKATPKSLGSPTLVSAAFRGQVQEKRGSIIVDWISSQPVANGLLLKMKDGSSSHYNFEDLYLKANQRQSKNLVCFQAAIDGKSHPVEWQQVELQAIDSVQLTKDAAPVGNVCGFRLPKKQDNSTDDDITNGEPSDSAPTIAYKPSPATQKMLDDLVREIKLKKSPWGDSDAAKQKLWNSELRKAIVELIRDRLQTVQAGKLRDTGQTVNELRGLGHLFQQASQPNELTYNTAAKLSEICWPVLLAGYPEELNEAIVELTVPYPAILVNDKIAEAGRPTEPLGWDVQAAHALALARAGEIEEALKENEALLKKIEVNVLKGRLPDLKSEFLGTRRSQKSLLQQTLLQKSLILAIAGGTAESVDASTTAGQVEVSNPTKGDQAAIQAILQVLPTATVDGGLNGESETGPRSGPDAKAVQVFPFSGEIKNVRIAEPELLGHGYVRDGQHVLFDGKRIDQEGSHDLERFARTLSRELKLASNVDAASFKALSEEYTKDKDMVYYKWISPGRFWVVELPEANPTSFESVAFNLAKDHKHVWWYGDVLKGLDPKTLEVVNANFVWKDSDSVWYQHERIADADPSTFTHIGQAYYRDKNRVYWGMTPLDGADPTTFRSFGDDIPYGADKNSVWRTTETVPKVDPATFGVVHESVYKDKTGVYSNGLRVSGASPETTRKLADLNEHLTALLTDGENHFVFVALWNEVYRIEPKADGLHVSREVWEGRTSPERRLGTMSALLTEQGWQDLKAPESELWGKNYYEQREAQTLSQFKNEFEIAWEILTGRKVTVGTSEEFARIMNAPAAGDYAEPTDDDFVLLREYRKTQRKFDGYYRQWLALHPEIQAQVDDGRPIDVAEIFGAELFGGAESKFPAEDLNDWRATALTLTQNMFAIQLRRLRPPAPETQILRNELIRQAAELLGKEEIIEGKDAEDVIDPQIDQWRLHFPEFLSLQPAAEKQLRSGQSINEPEERIKAAKAVLDDAEIEISRMAKHLLKKHELNKLTPLQKELLAQLITAESLAVKAKR